MKIKRTCAFICVLWLLTSSLSAQKSGHNQRFRGIQVRHETADTTWRNPTLAGMSLGFDAAGAIMAACTNYGQIEGQLRLNIRNRFFPTIEAGLGISDHTGEETHLHYRTHSPYFRVGIDYNFIRDLRSGNRIFGGVRYGFTPFKYDLSGPAIADPVYGMQVPFDLQGVTATAHWVEAVAGLEARIWKFFHLGWSLRYRARLAETNNPSGHVQHHLRHITSTANWRLWVSFLVLRFWVFRFLLCSLARQEPKNVPPPKKLKTSPQTAI